MEGHLESPIADTTGSEILDSVPLTVIDLPVGKRSNSATVSRVAEYQSRIGLKDTDRPKKSNKPTSSLSREDRWKNGVDWPVVVWIVVVHVGALAAPFFFTWKALGVFALLAWLTGGIGVCLGYHRLLTHSSFQTYPFMKRLCALLGGLSGEGSALMWVANHRKHHAYSDQDGDPHSPRDGGLWSHFLWFCPNFGRKHNEEMISRYSPDLLRDPVMRVLDKTFLLQHWLLGSLLFCIGWLGWDLFTGLSFLIWGTFVRMIYVLHVTWFVNSATHIWGYRNYETSDDSRNLWWVGLLAFGEGWHNNHHAYQRMAAHGHRWWEFDITYFTICVLEKLGLAWNVVHDVPGRSKRGSS